MCTTNSGYSEVDKIISKQRDRNTFGSCSMKKGYFRFDRKDKSTLLNSRCTELS